MSQQPPHTPTHPTHPDPAGPVAAEASLVDVVAGDPPVPITVWRTARTDTDPAGTLPARLAYRLVAAYSRPGDTVVDLTHDHALTAACATGGRRTPPGLVHRHRRPDHRTRHPPPDTPRTGGR